MKTAAATLMLWLTVGSLSACGEGASDADRCAELKDWYQDNPGDSNIDIAKDYYRACDDLPPPVLSGELDGEDIY